MVGYVQTGDLHWPDVPLVLDSNFSEARVSMNLAVAS